ncbi:urease accessory protein UreF [Clostridium sp. AL.422]|uniref:urease accessory protein UreF n=1 Tax=Clostridium TaxID=1485 RepID=UPI00293DFD48|nr:MULTISPECIES: urease accessory protein UreF [unclassified Clostridium]MDV4151835.1 urease accessory protein UreF [Clostridium sp. AL.422]
MLNSHILTKNSENNIINILRVIQICDSSFPIGSFNHSYGMETYLRNNKINSTESLKEYLHVFLNNVFIFSDGLAIRMLYEYLNKNELEKILELDRMLTVQTIAKETRNGSKLIAKRMINIFLDLYNIDILKEYEEKINTKEAFGHPAIVFGLLMYNLNFSEEEAISFHMYSTISTLIQNGVRAIPLGQKDGQIILKKCSENFKALYEKINNLDYSFFGASTPGIELSQINHEVLEFRLFMS